MEISPRLYGASEGETPTFGHAGMTQYSSEQREFHVPVIKVEPGLEESPSVLYESGGVPPPAGVISGVSHSSGKKRVLSCDLCGKTFSGTLFLRAHFRVEHGAEIVGLEGDDDEFDQEYNRGRGMKGAGRRKGQVKGQGVKRGRGRPRDSKSKTKKFGSLKGSDGKGKNTTGIDANIMSHFQRGMAQGVVKRRGRPPGSKSKLLKIGLFSKPLERSTVDAKYHVKGHVQGGLVQGTVKRGRGRPPGSKSKTVKGSVLLNSGQMREMVPGRMDHVPQEQLVPGVKRGRGRPKGSKTRKGKILLDSAQVGAGKTHEGSWHLEDLGDSSNIEINDDSGTDKKNLRKQLEVYQRETGEILIDKPTDPEKSEISLVPSSTSPIFENTAQQEISNEALEPFIESKSTKRNVYVPQFISPKATACEICGKVVTRKK